MISVVMLHQMGLSVEFLRTAPNEYRVRAWGIHWQKAISFSAVDPFDLACNIDIALGKLYAHALKAGDRLNRYPAPGEK
jgi:hypothetical protein